MFNPRACGLFICVSLCAGVQAQDDFARSSAAPQSSDVADAKVELAVLPTYPKRALRAGVDGEVTVAFTVSRYGRAVDARVISAKPKRVFDAAALDALKYWFIRPARADVCATTEQRAEQTFRFVHDGDPAVQLPPIVLANRVSVPAEAERVSELAPGTGREAMSRVVGEAPLVVIKRVEPDYPERALQRKREGFVTVSFFIEKDGRVTDPRIEAAKRGLLFGRAALSAIRRWEFAPTLQNGEPVERMGCHEFLFNIDARDKELQKKRLRERTRGGNF
ncbi:MAG: energy transducer TonB [Pseudomonadota bacterium]